LTSSHCTTTASVVDSVTAQLQRWRWVPELRFIGNYHDEPAYIEALATSIREHWRTHERGHLLFSFHGLPERQIKKSDPTVAHCLRDASCCSVITQTNQSCYRAQSYATARALASRLGVTDYTVCFQSRLGRTPWITPHTDVVLDELAKQGKKRLAVFCPAFVADCLETLEEIGIRARAQFKAAGGEELVLVPSLNATPEWIDAVCAMAERHAARKLLPVVT
jgi:ferrochelatase